MLLPGPTDTSAESGAAEAAFAKSALAPTAREIARLFIKFLQECKSDCVGKPTGSRTNGSGNRSAIFDRSPKNKSISAGTFVGRVYFRCVRILDARQPVDSMKKILLATVAILAFAAPTFAAETGKTVGQAPQSFYLTQDTATMKCEIVETQPVAGGKVKVVGIAHPTKASAETALKADKTCIN